MVNILVRPAELRQVSQSLRGQAQKIAQAMDAVDTQMRALKGQIFLGNRATALQARYEPKRDELLRTKDLIIYFADDLERAASTFEKADKGISSPMPTPAPVPPPTQKPAPAPSQPEPKPTPAPGDLKTVKKIQDTIHSMNVTKTSRYLPKDGKTWCNIFTMDYCKKMGVPLPEWLDFNQDKKIDDYLDANEATRWLKGTYDKGGVQEGPDLGWKTISADDAAKLASSGKVVVAGWENPGGIGHMAVVRPESTPGDIRIAQAGAKNFENGSVRDGFGNRTPTYFVYDP